MKIRYCSDIHLDFDYKNNPKNLWLPPLQEDDKETTLVIAGDLWVDGRHMNTYHPDWSWMAEVASQFKYVVYVLGNHDYYQGRFDTMAEKCRQQAAAQGLSNVFLLDCDKVVLDGITFVGGILWTDYGRRNPVSMMEASNYMNDYRSIRVGDMYRKLKPSDCLSVFDKTKKLIFDTAKECKEAGKLCIVVTHMAPSYQSINSKYRNSRDELSNTWYYSELSSYILDSGISYWFHGHLHDAIEYEIGNTEVICNPRGYVGYENGTGFTPTGFVEI